MLQKILFESSKGKNLDNKSSQQQSKSSSSAKYNPFFISKKVLYHKYSKFEYSFSLFCTNNLIFNEKCRIVARFKDFLVLDDSTEFLRRFYSKKELRTRLKKIFNFYESYCKIFPNYMILPESQFLYRNIRKKQKMIDAFNEIKKEEEENRQHLKLGKIDDNLKNKEQNVVFTKKIQESIERYHPSVSNLLSNTFMSDISNNFNNEINNDKNMVTISLSSQRPFNLLDLDKYFSSNKNSFLENDKNINDNTINSQNSIFKIVQILNNSNINENPSNSFNNKNNNIYNKIKKIEYKNNISQINSNKIIKNNNNNNNIKHNTKKLLVTNNYNSINSSSNKNIKINMNKISNLNNHSNTKKKKQEINNINANNKRKFISHKQTVSVPLASNMLNSNENNILEGKNTIKIINNINNIIINEDKNKTLNNRMIININNNYFQLKDPKKLNNKIIKRVKSKEDQKKQKSKSKDKKLIKDKEEKEDEYSQFKIFREKRTYTTYNTQNNIKKNKKYLINGIQSPNRKKENNNNHNLDIKKKYKNINSNTYYLNINNTNKQNNAYRNINNCPNENKKLNRKIIESKTLNNNSNTLNNNNRNITEINSNYKNIFGNKLKISMNKNKEKLKIEGVESIDNKKLSINRKIVNNYLTTTQKKKTYQGRFHDQESSSLNTFNNNNNTKINKKYNDPSEKIEVLNIYNTLQNKNNNNNPNPIKFKLDKKNMIKKTKTNSLQINNKNEFLSSFNLTKEKIPGTNIEIDIINIEDNIVKYHKKSIKKVLNNKTQSNSEAELIRDINHKNNALNTFTSKSLKKDKFKSNNDKKMNNNDSNINSNNINNEMKKINVKEMKEKYHKLLRGNKFTHGSYDTANRLHLLKKFRGLNNVMGNMANSINNTITSNKNKRSPLTKKNIMSPSERIQNTMGNNIKTPIKNKFNITNKETLIENNNGNTGNKFHLIGKKSKQFDTNNKKMKFIKK